MLFRLLRAFSRRLGWELRLKPPPPRATMTGALAWLRSQRIPVTTVLDVGASNGSWTRECLRTFPDAHYLLFEPQPSHQEALAAFAIERNGQVIPVPQAVGATVGHTFFDATDPMGGALMRSDGGTNSIRVEVTTIDATVASLHAKGPFLLKLDTHGYERSILEGAKATLNHTSLLVIEAYNYRITDEAFLFWELCTYLAERGFRPVDLVDVMHRMRDDSLWQMDLFFVRADWPGFTIDTYE